MKNFTMNIFLRLAWLVNCLNQEGYIVFCPNFFFAICILLKLFFGVVFCPNFEKSKKFVFCPKKKLSLCKIQLLEKVWAKYKSQKKVWAKYNVPLFSTVKSYIKLLEQAQQEYSTADDMYSVLGKIFKEKIVNVFKTIFELKDVIEDEAIDYNLLSEKIFTDSVSSFLNFKKTIF